MQSTAIEQRFVQVVERYDETVASYERLGFERVLAWDRGDGTRSTLFRTGPALLEVVDGSQQPVFDPTSLLSKVSA